MNTFLAVLDPAIKTFLSIVVIAGPISIAGMICVLKNIEKKSPERIRWR